jgi:hypothetical protein
MVDLWLHRLDLMESIPDDGYIRRIGHYLGCSKRLE